MRKEQVMYLTLTMLPCQTRIRSQQEAHIYAMLRRHGETGIIKNILFKTKDGQEAVKMIMLEYSDQHAGRARAEELRNKLNTRKILEGGGMHP